MRKVFKTGFFLLVFWTAFISISFAQFRYPIGSGSVQVGASIGEFYLSVSGYASPYASVVLTVNGVLLRSTVADQFGVFHISQVLISRGFSGFCLTAVDFKRIGDSEACIQIPPATGDVVIKDIFLPPTIGISQKQVAVGKSVFIYGYTMPNVVVTIHINKTTKVTVMSDSTGYYSYEFKSDRTGTFTFQSTAVYNNIPSLEPKREVSVTVLSPIGQAQLTGKQLIEKAISLITAPGLGFVWISLLLLILIIIILIKLKPKWMFIIFDKFKKRQMHHDWLLAFIRKHPLPAEQKNMVQEISDTST